MFMLTQPELINVIGLRQIIHLFHGAAILSFSLIQIQQIEAGRNKPKHTFCKKSVFLVTSWIQNHGYLLLQYGNSGCKSLHIEWKPEFFYNNSKLILLQNSKMYLTSWRRMTCKHTQLFLCHRSESVYTRILIFFCFCRKTCKHATPCVACHHGD